MLSTDLSNARQMRDAELRPASSELVNRMASAGGLLYLPPSSVGDLLAIHLFHPHDNLTMTS